MNGSEATFRPTCFMHAMALAPAIAAPEATSTATFSLGDHCALISLYLASSARISLLGVPGYAAATVTPASQAPLAIASFPCKTFSSCLLVVASISRQPGYSCLPGAARECRLPAFRSPYASSLFLSMRLPVSASHKRRETLFRNDAALVKDKKRQKRAPGGPLIKNILTGRGKLGKRLITKLNGQPSFFCGLPKEGR